ncbi:MAG: TonB-dependent receptor [Sphingobacteriaceae bacterium]|nr:MAG: TonB-dependent receptor [Sphingobacteriaceae bacterium]
MKFKISFLILFLSVFFSTVFADTNFAVNGKVIDAQTKEPLIGAVISIPQIKVTATTNVNGEFLLTTLPKRGRFLVQVAYIGYKTLTQTVDFAASATLQFALQPSVIEGREVVIVGTAISSNNKQNSTSVSTLTREQLTAPANNLIDAIAKQVPGVSQITTGPAISKPVIRGLSYNRVVTLSDGVKQQGQQWGDEHGIEIDQYSPERAEVLRGAASLLYGSDALGGVINLLEPLPAPVGQIKGEVLTNYSTNNGLSGNSLMLTGNENGFVWRARGSYLNANSFKTPTGYYSNSGYNVTNLSAMIGLNKEWGYSHINVNYFKNNIGFYEAESGNPLVISDQGSRTLDFPRQDIRHYKIGWNSNFILPSGQLKVDLGYQKNQRRELDNADPALFFDLNTYSADLKYYLEESNGWQPVFGLSGDAGISQNKGTEFLVPAYDTYGLGAFAYVKKTWDKNTFNAGLRYDYRTNSGKSLVEEGVTRFAPFTNRFSNISGAAGFTHEFNDHLNFKANAGSAFRAPNPAELGSNGVHEGTFRYEVGAPNLAPERSYQADATLEYDSNFISGSLGIYENYIHNFIYASNRVGDNITVIDDNGNPQLYPVYHYGQVNANLAGFEGSLTLHPVSFIHFENLFGYTYAQNTTLNRPLSFIPAGSLRNTLRFEPKIKKIKLIKLNTMLLLPT